MHIDSLQGETIIKIKSNVQLHYFSLQNGPDSNSGASEDKEVSKNQPNKNLLLKRDH